MELAKFSYLLYCFLPSECQQVCLRFQTRFEWLNSTPDWQRKESQCLDNAWTSQSEVDTMMSSQIPRTCMIKHSGPTSNWIASRCLMKHSRKSKSTLFHTDMKCRSSDWHQNYCTGDQQELRLCNQKRLSCLWKNFN